MQKRTLLFIPILITLTCASSIAAASTCQKLLKVSAIEKQHNAIIKVANGSDSEGLFSSEVSKMLSQAMDVSKNASEVSFLTRRAFSEELFRKKVEAIKGETKKAEAFKNYDKMFKTGRSLDHYGIDLNLLKGGADLGFDPLKTARTFDKYRVIDDVVEIYLEQVSYLNPLGIVFSEDLPMIRPLLKRSLTLGMYNSKGGLDKRKVESLFELLVQEKSLRDSTSLENNGILKGLDKKTRDQVFLALAAYPELLGSLDILKRLNFSFPVSNLGEENFLKTPYKPLRNSTNADASLSLVTDYLNGDALREARIKINEPFGGRLDFKIRALWDKFLSSNSALLPLKLNLSEVGEQMIVELSSESDESLVLVTAEFYNFITN